MISVSISAIEAFICSTRAALAARAASLLLLFSSLCFCASCAATSRAAASMAAALSDTADSPPGVLGSDLCCADAPEQRCKEEDVTSCQPTMHDPFLFHMLCHNLLLLHTIMSFGKGQRLHSTCTLIDHSMYGVILSHDWCSAQLSPEGYGQMRWLTGVQAPCKQADMQVSPNSMVALEMVDCLHGRSVQQVNGRLTKDRASKS